jgi:hypothetical protein
MSGILNKNSRIMDYVLTENGRQQIQNGDIRFKYFTISDSSIVYSNDEKSLLDQEVSNSEYYYLPFESSTDPDNDINPEYSLDNILNLNSIPSEVLSIADSAEKFLDLNTNFTVSDQLINKKLLNTESLISDESLISFEEKSVKRKFDFKPSASSSREDINEKIRSYLTVDKIEKSIDNIKRIFEDKRFSHKLNYKKMVPINKDGTEITDVKQDNDIYDPLLYIYKDLNVKTDITSESSRPEVIVSAVEALRNSNTTFKNYYKLTDANNIDSFLIELHELNEISTDSILIKSTRLIPDLQYKIIELDPIDTYFLKEFGVPDDCLTEGCIFTTSEKVLTFDISNFKRTKVARVEKIKLSIIDLGEFFNKEKQSMMNVYLAGKIYINKNNVPIVNHNSTNNVITRDLSVDYSFVNLFTIVVE